MSRVSRRGDNWNVNDDSELKELFRAQKGDQDALVRMLERYRVLIKLFARRYFLPYGDMEDLIQEATIGFCKGCS